jgi:hypothetical protein
MKKLFTLIAIFICFVANAQNYNCLQSGVKHYFTNADGYLRGIRIDSVRASGSDTVYYPFHTERGHYYPWGSPISIDTNGSSWLGKNVIQKADGTFIFNNFWDTVYIRSKAHLGESWVFFKDTNYIHYTAMVTSVDTMTILGVIDSVKKISIKADSAGTIVTVDPLNNFSIILSKNYGFVQVFDLYTFPYHTPSITPYDVHTSNYVFRGYDYYLDNL